MEEGAARVVLVGAWPLDASFGLDALPGHSGVHRGNSAQLLPEVLGGWPTPAVVTQVFGQVSEDIDLLASPTGRWHRGPGALYSAFAVGHGAVGFGPPQRGG